MRLATPMFNEGPNSLRTATLWGRRLIATLRPAPESRRTDRCPPAFTRKASYIRASTSAECWIWRGFRDLGPFCRSVLMILAVAVSGLLVMLLQLTCVCVDRVFRVGRSVRIVARTCTSEAACPSVARPEHAWATWFANTWLSRSGQNAAFPASAPPRERRPHQDADIRSKPAGPRITQPTTRCPLFQLARPAADAVPGPGDGTIPRRTGCSLTR